MEAIVKQRIKNARIHKGLSMQQLAESLGISKQMVSKYEQGKAIPTSDKLIALSRLLDQKVDYFFKKPEVTINDISFRKKSRFPAKKVNTLKEEIRIKIENYLYIENICNLSESFTNPLQNQLCLAEEDSKITANALKEAWNIGRDAIHNIIDLFEDHQIKVIEIEEDSNDFDGLATVIDSKYHIIVIARSMPVERKRFTLLHELGHLLLQIDVPDLKQKEKMCDVFASEMLLSEQNAKNEFGDSRSSISFEELKNIQEKYGISIPAIVYKLGESKIISKERVKSFFMKLNSNQEFKSIMQASRFEGNEHSIRYENLVFRAVSEELISMSKASSLLQIGLNELKNKMTERIG